MPVVHLPQTDQDYYVYLFRHGGSDFQPDQSLSRQLKQGLPKIIQTIVKDTKIKLSIQVAVLLN